MLHGCKPQVESQNESNTVDGFLLCPPLHEPLLKSTKEISLLFSRFIAACSITCSQPKSCYTENDMSAESRSKQLDGYFFEGLLPSLWTLRATLRIISDFVAEDLIMKLLIVLDLFEFYVHFASAWLQKNSRVLLLMVQPLLITHTNGHTPYEVDIMDLKKLLPQIAELVAQNRSIDDKGEGFQASNNVQNKQAGDVIHSIPEDERWQIIGTCLWQHMSRFMKQKLDLVSDKFEDECFPGVSLGILSSTASRSTNLESDGNSVTQEIRLVSLSLAKLLKTTVTHLSSYHVKQLASFLWQKVENGLQVATLLWLKESSEPQPGALYRGTVNIDILKNKDKSSISEILWDICTDSKIISEGFANGEVNLSHFFNHKPSKAWGDKYIGLGVHETEESYMYDSMHNGSFATSEAGSPARSLFRNGPTFLSSWRKDTTYTKEITTFQQPKEIYKRNGELLEVIFLYSFLFVIYLFIFVSFIWRWHLVLKINIFHSSHIAFYGN